MYRLREKLRYDPNVVSTIRKPYVRAPTIHYEGSSNLISGNSFAVHLLCRSSVRRKRTRNSQRLDCTTYVSGIPTVRCIFRGEASIKPAASRFASTQEDEKRADLTQSRFTTRDNTSTAVLETGSNRSPIPLIIQ
jgi:hypothetical protein